MIELITDRHFTIEQKELPDDHDLVPSEGDEEGGFYALGSYLEGRLIGRALAHDENRNRHDLKPLTGKLHYSGDVTKDGGIIATLSIRLMASEEREAWQPESEAQLVNLPLGIVIRLPKDRKYPNDSWLECFDHFATIIGSGAVPLVDKILEGM